MNAQNSFGFKKLIIYQKSKGLALLIYKLTENWPKSEIYGLISQIRRSSVSVAANIVEGYSRKGPKEFCHFIDISIGSLAETEVYLELALELKYSTETEINKILGLTEEVKKLLYSFKLSLENKSKEK